MSVRIAVELSDEELERLDVAVAKGGFDSREAAVHAALRPILARPTDDELAEGYRRAYGRFPEDESWGEVGLKLAAESLRDERG